MIKSKCLKCKNIFLRYPSNLRKYCSRDCMSKCPIFVNKQKNIKIGKTPWNKGKTKFKSKEEKRIANLESGRKSYRKHIETRLFYYRQLSHKRRRIEGSFSLKQWEDLLKKQKYQCLFCKSKDKKLTIDHIIPISKWDKWILKNNVNYKCNDIQNIQALCGSCNSKKHTKIS